MTRLKTPLFGLLAALVIGLAVLLGSMGTVIAAPVSLPQQSLVAPAVTTAVAPLNVEETNFLNLINQYRQAHGLGTLTLNLNLYNSAKWMSRDMAAYNYFSHTDSLGRNSFVRMAAFGYNFNTYKGENIAAGYMTAAQVMVGWQNSPGHNANMLNPNYKTIGIGRGNNPASTYYWYWTTDFGGQ